MKAGSKSDRIDARKLAELLRGKLLKSVYHGEREVRMLRELARSYDDGGRSDLRNEPVCFWGWGAGLKAHALLQRDGHRYAYRLTDKGIRVALMFILFHQGVCGPLANSLFHRTPAQFHTPASKLQAAYAKADASIRQVIDLLAA